MIISDKHKYIFIEIPRTGSTAISKELREKYDGREILYKHANYSEFLKQATPEEKQYYVFAGVRNPLDEIVSLYNKLLTNHLSDFTNEQKLIKNGGWIGKKRLKMFEFVQENNDFGAFLKRFYKLAYTSNISVNKKHCDFIIRFESLEDDFSKVLKQLDVKKKRPLPHVNKTRKKGDPIDYYRKDSISYAIKTFGPFMREWGYEIPKKWRGVKVTRYDKVIYRLAKLARIAYSKYIKGGPLKKVTKLRDILE